MGIGTEGLGSSLKDIIDNGGGGGVTVIPDGGSLSGTYEGLVLCEGDASLSGNTTINGNLLCLVGAFENDSGHSLTVYGDAVIRSLDFTPSDTEVAQADITIVGSLIFLSIVFPQTNGLSRELRVDKDLAGALTSDEGGTIDGPGYAGSPGLTIYVGGDCSAFRINLNGGSSTETSGGGNGGALRVRKNLLVQEDLSVRGGNSLLGTFGAGNGGTIVVGGTALLRNDDWSTTVYMTGGTAENNTGSAGSGGELTVYNDAYIDNLYGGGGDCYSTDPSHDCGNGGSVYVYGSLSGQPDFYLNGGSRYGALATAGEFSEGGQGGYVSVRGSADVTDIEVRGGDIFTTGESSSDAAGPGGSIFIYGNLYADDLRLYGGYNDCVSGTGALVRGGLGGEISVRGSLVCDALTLYGGLSQLGDGGNGGSVNVGGNARIDSLRVYGGYSYNGTTGGEGGNVYIHCDLVLDDNGEEELDLTGGSCQSTIPSARGGNGGNLTCGSLMSRVSTLKLNAGSRTGTLAAPNDTFYVVSGGDLTVYGDCILNAVETNGSGAVTNLASQPGGNGGTIEIYGAFIVEDDVELSGGNSTDLAGGNGGSLTVRGPAILQTLFMAGGDSVGSTPAQSGAGGTAYFRGGLTAQEVLMTDGSGGSAASADSILGLGGTNTIDAIAATDRINVRIVPAGTAWLAVSSMSLKKTLNNGDNGGPTDDLTAFLGSNVFVAMNSYWLRIPGTSVHS